MTKSIEQYNIDITKKLKLIDKDREFYLIPLQENGIYIYKGNTDYESIDQFIGVLKSIYGDNTDLLLEEFFVEKNEYLIEEYKVMIDNKDYRKFCQRILDNNHILSLLNSKNINENTKNIIKMTFLQNFFKTGPGKIHDNIVLKLENRFQYLLDKAYESYISNTKEEIFIKDELESLEKACDVTINSLQAYKEKFNLLKDLSDKLENNSSKDEEKEINILKI